MVQRKRPFDTFKFQPLLVFVGQYLQMQSPVIFNRGQNLHQPTGFHLTLNPADIYFLISREHAIKVAKTGFSGLKVHMHEIFIFCF